ncbi:DUF4138 domain-containing protein [Confluentibacter sediminis]|uniref:DUF4138 domain-containing protein n=1 Tax=Confluentibacter sediminis TaxID=2219045 RepID=UPI000DAEE293|nr:DUF4138 domain-containing protein [Confluentibacter sediminis]
MNPSFTYAMLFMSIITYAQPSLDTIYANEYMNVALFFPKQIRQGITGAENFAFSYNRENQQYFGLLQATPGVDSNLLIITTDGNVYSYILKYAKTVTKLNYFIGEHERIRNEKLEDVKSIGTVDTLINYKEKANYYERFSESLLQTKQYPSATKREKGMVLRLLRTVYDKNEVYLVLEIKNNSGIDFELDYLGISKAKISKRHKGSYQKIEQDILYRYKEPKTVFDQSSNQFVFVLPKFVLGDKEKLHLEVKELNGSRKLTLETKN